MTARLSRPIVWEDEGLVSVRFDDEDDDYEDEEEEDLDEEFDEDLDDDEELDEVDDEEEVEAFEDEELYDEDDGSGSHPRRQGDWE